MPTLKGRAGQETEKAILFTAHKLVYPNGSEEECKYSGWFPLSQVISISRNPNLNEDDSIVISEWIAEKKGLYLELD